jgi:hypothetical protein
MDIEREIIRSVVPQQILDTKGLPDRIHGNQSSPHHSEIKETYESDTKISRATATGLKVEKQIPVLAVNHDGHLLIGSSF